MASRFRSKVLLALAPRCRQPGRQAGGQNRISEHTSHVPQKQCHRITSEFVPELCRPVITRTTVGITSKLVSSIESSGELAMTDALAHHVSGTGCDPSCPPMKVYPGSVSGLCP